MRFFYALCCFSVFIYDCVCFFHPQGAVSPCPCLTVWISPQDIPSTPAAVLNTGGQGSPDILGQRLQGILATPPRITPYSTPLVPTNMEEDQTFPTHNTPLQELTQVGQSKSLLIHFHISEQWISVNWLVEIFYSEFLFYDWLIYFTVTSSAQPGSTSTVTEEHLRMSLLSAVEDKMKRRLREMFEQAQVSTCRHYQFNCC